VAVGVDPRDRQDFAELYGTHQTSLYRFFVRRVGPIDAEELVAQVVLEAWAGRRGFDPERGDAGGWLFGIAHNVLRRHWRTAARRARAAAALPRPDDDLVDELALAGRLDAWVAAGRVRVALSTLSPIDREVLELCGAGRTPTEIAAALGVAPGTVKSRLSRARHRLARRVDHATL
jgi:RNA polymerase sigma factor (sigma-70 family)